MAISAKIFTLSYDSASLLKSVALKNNYLSLRLIKNSGIVNPGKESYITNILLNGKCIDAENRRLYVFYIDTFYNASWIIEIDIDKRVQKVVYYDPINNIGFDHRYKIYNASVVFGKIVWTDNLNNIYQVDIERAKNSFYYGIGYGKYPQTYNYDNAVSYLAEMKIAKGNYFYRCLVDNVGQDPDTSTGYWERLCMIEDAYFSMNIENFYFAPIPPSLPPTVQYFSDESRKINNLKQSLFQIAYRYVYMDWRRSTFSPASIVAMPNFEEEVDTGLANEQISLNNTLKITVNAGGEEVRAIEIIGRSNSDLSTWFLIDTINKFDEEERAGEISKVILKNKVEVSLLIKAPTVTSISLTAASRNIVGLNVLPATNWIIEIDASDYDMIWDAIEFGAGFGKTTTITLKGIPDCNVLQVPDWITIKRAGFDIIEGDTLIDGDVLTIYPTIENLGVSKEDQVILNEVDYGNRKLIFVSQRVTLKIPALAIYVLPEDTSGLVIVNDGSYGENGSPWLVLKFTPANPLVGQNTDFNLYYGIWKDGTASGSGVMMNVRNNTSNEKLVEMSSNAAPGNTIVIVVATYEYTIPVPPPDPPEGIVDVMNLIGKFDFNLSVKQPSVENSYLDASGKDMEFQAVDHDNEAQQNSVITVQGGTGDAEITHIPSWITLIDALTLTPLNETDSVSHAQELGIYPNAPNGGVQRDDTIEFEDTNGDTLVIDVRQLQATTDPHVAIYYNEEDPPSGMTLIDTSGNASIGSPAVNITFTPNNPRYGTLVTFTVDFVVYKNGQNVASGEWFVDNETVNNKSFNMSSNAAANDVILVLIGEHY